MGKADWASNRYPVAFHSAIRTEGAVIPGNTLPWTLISSRLRFYRFLQAAGLSGQFTARVVGEALVISKVERLDTGSVVLQALTAGGKNCAGGG